MKQIENIQAISPSTAAELIHADARCLLIDIRSSMEFLFVGHAVGAIHIPWIVTRKC